MNKTQTYDLPKGIQSISSLPESEHAQLWKSIIIEDGLRQKLVSQAVSDVSAYGTDLGLG